MKLNPYSNSHRGAAIGSLPLLATLLLLTLHYVSGGLDWPQRDNLQVQRDLNAAVGLSVMTGYLWFALRLLHQNVASTLISLLVKTNQLSLFSLHRNTLFSRFKHQGANCLIVSLLLTLVYVFIEGLLFNNPSPHQYMLMINGIIFGFFFCLFLAQITSNIHYLKHEILEETENTLDLLHSISALAKLGFVSATTAVGMFALFPILWFDTNVPVIDIRGAIVLTLIITCYLLLPILRLRGQWLNVKSKEYLSLSARKEKILSEQGHCLTRLRHLESEREVLIEMPMVNITTRDKLRLIACVATVVSSWLICGVV